MTSPNNDTATWDTDVTRFCMRLRDRFIQQGYPRPLPAAIASALRGRHGADVAQFATVLDLPVELVERIEAGQVALGDLPPELLELADDTFRLDWSRLHRSA
jgi:hypothetical protein